jgi:hypothetical protein
MLAVEGADQGRGVRLRVGKADAVGACATGSGGRSTAGADASSCGEVHRAPTRCNLPPGLTCTLRRPRGARVAAPLLASSRLKAAMPRTAHAIAAGLCGDAQDDGKVRVRATTHF